MVDGNYAHAVEWCLMRFEAIAERMADEVYPALHEALDKESDKVKLTALKMKIVGLDRDSLDLQIDANDIQKKGD